MAEMEVSRAKATGKRPNRYNSPVALHCRATLCRTTLGFFRPILVSINAPLLKHYYRCQGVRARETQNTFKKKLKTQETEDWGPFTAIHSVRNEQSE